MDGTYIISDYKAFIKSITEELKIDESHIISLPTLDNDSSYHDWTKQIFADHQINKLIIPISLPTDYPINTVGIRIALHIRLNYELKLSQRLIPIVLLSDLSYHKFLDLNYSENDNNPQNLLFTKGIYLSSFDIDEIQKVLGKAESCPPENYHSSVLNKLKILRKANTGKHSIANAWGCFKLAAVTGLRDEIFKDEAVSHHLKTLYAKYLICYNNAWTDYKYANNNPIKCSGRKILFIDDQSDEGWFKLIKKIFNEAGENFISVDSSKYKNKETKLFHDYKGFYTECQGYKGTDWDLIIIDLRLNPEKEDIDNEDIAPTEFSGYKLIDEFLNENEGYQIIVSTASNKIWNINATLQRGANTYYIKESPDFNYSLSETKKHYDNFKLEIQKCFERSYLKDIYKDINTLKQYLDSLSYPSIFIQEVKYQLDIAYFLLHAANSGEQFAYAYVSLYLVIETINKEFVIRRSDDIWEITGVGDLLDWHWDDVMRRYTNTPTAVNDNKPPEWLKFAGIYFQKWGETDSNFIKEISILIRKRNGITHNDRSILDKQDSSGNYLNHDIYYSDGFINLFFYVKKILNYL